MAKENVQITFSADTQQARQLFQVLSEGLNKTGERTRKQSAEFRGLEGALGNVITRYASFGAAVAGATRLIDQETAALNRRADAFERVEAGMQRVAVEGGLSPAQEKVMRGAITQAGLASGAESPAQIQSLAASLLEARFSAETLSGGGLTAAAQGLAAINATGANADPSRLGKSLANIMQATGAPMTSAGIQSTMQQMHGLLNATGAEMGDVESMMIGMGRISPRQQKALAAAGLRPEMIDPRRHGIGGAIANWYAATGGMDPMKADTLASRAFGDSAATALRRAQPGFDLRLLDPAGYARDLARATTGDMADLRRSRFLGETADAASGNIDAQYRQAQAAAARGREGSFFGRAANLVSGPIDAASSLLFGDDYKRAIIRQGRSADQTLKIEIRDAHGNRANGHAVGTQHLKGLK